MALERIQGYLERISEIASKADVSPIEFADRQSILLTNPGLNGRLQVTNTIRCAISIYNPGDIAPAHRALAQRQPHHPVQQGRLHQSSRASAATATRGDMILTPNGTWHDHGNDPTSR